MKHINNAIDAVCKWLIRIGARRFKGAVIDVRIGDESYVLRKYWPKHNIKYNDATKELKDKKPRLSTSDFWAANAEKINSPGYVEDEYLVLDTFEEKLP